jgi:pyroglutamyl-peptidase
MRCFLNQYRRISTWCLALIIGITTYTLCPSIAQAIETQPRLRILISGFEPFGGYSQNPTAELARRYAQPKIMDDILVKGVELPVVYFQAWDKLKREIETFHPDFILCLGFAPGDKRIRLERTAINTDHGYPDNQDQSHQGQIIVGGVKKIESDLPVDLISSKLKEKGIPTFVSDDAGGYLCNHIFYQLMYHILHHTDKAGAFVHMPDWPVEGDTPSTLSNALGVILKQIKVRYRRVALVEFEPIHGQVRTNLARMCKVIKAARSQRIDLVAFPEMSLTGLIWEKKQDIINQAEPDSGELVKTLITCSYSEEREIASSGLNQDHGPSVTDQLYKTSVAFGYPELNKKTGLLYNSYLYFDAVSQKTIVYRKRHLYGSDNNWAVPGNNKNKYEESSLGKLHLFICHDVVYPESFSNIPSGHGQLVLIGTNWIGNTPISDYLKEIPKNVLVIVADRKGSEDRIIFSGNTCVIRRDGLIIRDPKTKLGSEKALIYSYLTDEW